MELIRDYWLLILIVVLAALVVGYLLLRPRQRVRLTDSAPLRPHMMRPPVDRGHAGEAGGVTAEFVHSPHHRRAEGSREPADDDYCRMKGVGPKFAEALHRLGFHRFDQLAQLTPTEIERLDGQLGAFSGRLIRDRVVEQADYLARNDTDGYEQVFGKL
jgi:predicted flap endonuclease-1-like 5' DNA nuclease